MTRNDRERRNCARPRDNIWRATIAISDCEDAGVPAA